MKIYYVNRRPQSERKCDKKAKQIKTIFLGGGQSVSYGGFYNCHFENGNLILWNCYAGANWHFSIPESEVSNLDKYFVGLPNSLNH